MKNLVLLCSLLFSATSLLAQTDSLPDFPEDFVGNWAGELEIYNKAGLAQTIPMQLRVQPLGDTAYTYGIVYGEDEEKGLRDYIIVPGTDGPHHWVCDERNTILLDGYYLGNVYQSVFAVQGSYIISSVEHRGDHLLYAITAGKTEPVRLSGKETHEGEEIPAVEAFLVAGYQRATLRRK